MRTRLLVMIFLTTVVWYGFAYMCWRHERVQYYDGGEYIFVTTTNNGILSAALVKIFYPAIWMDAVMVGQLPKKSLRHLAYRGF